MGLSASQAKLLSITARLADNELHSQFITNAKMRLATDSSEATAEYMRSLDATQLMYTTYDAKGNKSYQKLTPGIIMTYGDLKNQYGIVNQYGQLMVSSTDAQNFADSKNMAEFLGKYNVGLKSNPRYTSHLESIYGKQYGQFFDKNNPTAWHTGIVDGSDSLLKQIGTYDDVTGTWTLTSKDRNSAAYAALKAQMADWYSNLNSYDMEGTAAQWTQALSEPPYTSLSDTPPAAPVYDTEPQPPNPFDIDAFIASFPWPATIVPSTGNCWAPTNWGGAWMDGSNNHYTHHFAAFMYDFDAIGLGSGILTGLVQDRDTPDAAQTNIVNKMQSLMANSYYGVKDDSIYNGSPLMTYSNNQLLTSVAKLNTDLLNVFGKLAANAGGAAISAPNKTAVNTALDTMKPYLNSLQAPGASAIYSDLMSQLSSATTNNQVAYIIADGYYNILTAIIRQVEFNEALIPAKEQRETEATIEQQKYNQDYAAWVQDCAAKDSLYQAQLAAWESSWDAQWNALENWLNQCQGLNVNVSDALNSVPAQEIPNQDDPKTQWYINLWYRMGGISETTKSSTAANNYRVLDDKYMNNSAWLQYAIENGIVTVEQVMFDENGSVAYPGLENHEWKSTIYTSIIDITYQDDTLAIARAEAKYEQALREIEQKDKKYDSDLKKLETQHSSMQTEYESMKGIIDKNIERSFKAFS